MSDSSRKTSNGTVEQIMRNMTKDIHSDGQYIQFTPPPTPQDSWNMHSPMPQPSYMSFNMHSHSQPPEASLPYGMEPYVPPQPVPPYNYIQQPPIYGTEHYDKHLPNQNDLSYVYPNHGVQDFVFSPEYKSYLSKNMHNINVSDHTGFMQAAQRENQVHMVNNTPESYMPQESPPPSSSMPNRTPLIDNVVGNWTPNTSGTYSQFGNTSSFNTSNIFEQVQDIDCISSKPKQVIETKDKFLEFDMRTDDAPNFQFSRDTKKPRMVAEVKPMRPSYSDVLLKSVPPTSNLTNAKPNKVESKEAKLRKETKKNLNIKQVKANNSLNRSNTSNEIKDLSNDKANIKNTDKLSKDNKGGGSLNRKWASLDNVTDTYTDFKNDLNESKKTQRQKVDCKSQSGKVNPKSGKTLKNESNDTDSTSSKPDVSTVNKVVGTGRKLNKLSSSSGRQKNHESSFSNTNSSDSRPPGKRSQRMRKKENNVPFGIIGQKVLEYLAWWKYIVKFIVWLFHLISDILSLSVHLSKDAGSNFYSWLTVNSVVFWESLVAIVKRIRVLTWIYEKFKKEPEKKLPQPPPGLHNNINMPATGEEAMKRLLACKGKDPYSILGVTPFCTDADIKNYYKKQAKLVHPDKNQQPGAEEAFKILVHAFNMIGEPERRAAYDRGVAESAQAEQAMTELTELLVQLQQKVEAAANTIRCSACGLRHKRVKVDRPIYAARNCTSCKIHHSAREGDIWAEARCFGFLWYYFACMDGGVYDITEWAACQKDSLKHLKPDSHNVQYRIALGKQSTSNTSNRRQQQQQQQQQQNMSFPRTNDRNADLNNFINNLYGQTAADSTQANMRRKAKKTK